MVNQTNQPVGLQVGDRVKLEKGCMSLNLERGTSARVTSIEPLGADYSHSVKVVLYMLNGFRSGRTAVLFARHINRLGDSIVALNDGNPSHSVKVRRVR